MSFTNVLPSSRCSTSRLRGRTAKTAPRARSARAPVLHWTLERTARASGVGSMAVLCWEDQLPAVLPVAGEDRAYMLSKGPRVVMPEVEAIAAARRWADGWRGGLLSTCHFDLGFHGPWHREVAERVGSDAVLLIDPAAGLVDPVLLDRLIEHAEGAARSGAVFLPCGAGTVRRTAAAGPARPARSREDAPGPTAALPARPARRASRSRGRGVCRSAAVARTTLRFSLTSRPAGRADRSGRR